MSRFKKKRNKSTLQSLPYLSDIPKFNLKFLARKPKGFGLEENVNRLKKKNIVH